MAELVEGFQFLFDYKNSYFFGSARFEETDHWYKAQNLAEYSPKKVLL